MAAEPTASAEPSIVEGEARGFAPHLLTADLEQAAECCPDRAAFRMAATDFSYAALHDAAGRLAGGLAALGVGPGDRIATLMPNHPLFLVALHAAWRRGAAMSGLNPLYGQPLLQRQLAEVTPKVLLTLDEPELLAKARAVAPQGAVVLAATPSGAELLPGADAGVGGLAPQMTGPAPAPAPLTVDDLALLQFTGGTTWVPKAAELTHRNISINNQQLAARLPRFGYACEDFLALPPFSHIIGSSIILCLGVKLAATLHPVARFVPEEAVRLMVAQRISFLSGVPPMFMAIARLPAAQGTDWSALKYCMTGGAAIPASVIAEFEGVTGAPLLTAYGLSETAPGAVLALEGEKAPEGGTGRPLPETKVEIRDIEDPARIVPRGSRGEICISGPQVTRGYFGRPEETAHALGQGFLRTGDIGVIDAEGFIWVVDRLKDIIIASGYNIYPALVEEALYRHPDIVEAAVVGAPDDYRGETVKAVVVLAAGKTLALEDLQAFLKDSLSPMEMPKLLEVRSELPRSPAGKILRRALKAEG